MFDENRLDHVTKFEFMVDHTGGSIFHGKSEDLSEVIGQRFPMAERIMCTPILKHLLDDRSLVTFEKVEELESLDLMVIHSKLGVCENGAVWIEENDLEHRIQPFITKDVLVLLEKNNIVWNMHEAYERINLKETGYGVFIAGPSKTADIEKTLVIGAQGALSYHVMLI